MKGSLQYLVSSLEPASWPRVLSPRGEPLPEIALAGRSNVGKSTLINWLAGRKKLAKVSSTPGKTQRLQFFLLDQRCLFVDLPGYGYARAPQAIRVEWSQAIDCYLNTRSSLKLLLLLLDIRRAPTDDDIRLVTWARNHPMPFLVILTKSDRVTPKEKAENFQKIATLLSVEPISIPAPQSVLWSQIEKVLA